MGSKSRIAKYIIPLIQEKIDDSGYVFYIEPFCGGCNVIDKIEAPVRVACDLNPHLIALWKHLQKGGELPEVVPRDVYSDVRSNRSRYPAWYVGAVGFIASFNGRFFDGGYAKSGYEGERFRDYYQEAKRNILQQVDNIRDVRFYCRDYKTITPKKSVIYCDPPYQGTKEYSNSNMFDSGVFWETVRGWSADNIVLVSEENAPDDFECVWSQEVSRSIKATDKSKSTEKLFVYKGREV